MKIEPQSKVTQSVFHRWWRFLSSPGFLLTFSLLMILSQFISQMEIAVRGWHFEWPYWPDQNRYIRYALLYRAAWTEKGFLGLIEAYQQRPPYSFTLLVSSIPLLAWAEQTVHVLHVQLGYFLIALDVAVFRLAWRTGKSMYAGIAALMLMHGSTIGIFNSGGFLVPAEMLFYQLSFATTVTSIVGLALLVEMIYAKRVGWWSILLSLFLLGALWLRPSAMPYFFAQLVPPSLALGAWYFWQGERRHGWYVTLAVAAAVVLATPHLIYISRLVIDYAERAHRDFAIYSYTYYWERAEITTPVFITAFHLLMFGVLCDLPRLYGLISQGKERISRPAVSRLIAVWGISSWIYICSYLLPSISPAKNERIGDAFLLLTLAYGAGRGFTLINFLARREWRYPIDRAFLRSALTASLVLICSLVMAADIRGSHLTLEAWPAFKRDKLLSRRITAALEESINRWADKHELKHVPVHPYGNLGVSGAFMTDSILSRPGVDRIEGTKIWTGYSSWDKKVVAVVPILDTKMRKYVLVRGYKPYSEEDMVEALAEVKAHGLKLHERIEIEPGITLEVYVRTDEQLKQKNYEPIPTYP